MPKDSGHKYSKVEIHLFEICDDEGIKENRNFTEFGDDRDTFTSNMYFDRKEMSAGDYYLIAEVFWVEGTKDKSFALNCYSRVDVTAQDVTDSVNIGSIFAKWGETTLKDAKANIAEGDEEGEDDKNLLSFDWPYKGKYVNGPMQYERETTNYKVIIINNFRDLGSWIVTSEIKDPETQFIYPEAGKTLDLTIEKKNFGVVVLKQTLEVEEFAENYFDTQQYDEAAGVELEEYAKE